MKKALFVTAGGSFRSGGGRTSGGSVNTIMGLPNSYEEQKLATTTHLQYIDYLKNQGYEVDVVVGTYETQYTKDLLSWYKITTPKLEAKIFDFTSNSAAFLEKPAGAPGYGLSRMFQLTINNINLDSYDFIIYIRVDVVIKNLSLFISKLNIQSTQLLLAYNLMDPYLSFGGHPFPTDMIMFIPKNLFNKINFSEIEIFHSMWKWFVDSSNLSTEDIGYMLDTMHDSDSAKDWNPLYRLANRYSVSRWSGVGFKYDPKTKTTFVDPNLEETKKLYAYQA